MQLDVAGPEPKTNDVTDEDSEDPDPDSGGCDVEDRCQADHD
jgi:hypothetical protein